MKKALVCVSFLLIILGGCASSRMALYTAPVSQNVTLYYIPMTSWQPIKGTSFSATLDFTYKNEEGSPVVCNVSVFSQEVLPHEVSAASLECEKAKGILHNIKQLLVRPEKKELRITAQLDIKDFLKILESEEIFFMCSVDGAESRFKAPKDFYYYAEQFLLSLGRK